MEATSTLHTVGQGASERPQIYPKQITSLHSLFDNFPWIKQVNSFIDLAFQVALKVLDLLSDIVQRFRLQRNNDTWIAYGLVDLEIHLSQSSLVLRLCENNGCTGIMNVSHLLTCGYLAFNPCNYLDRYRWIWCIGECNTCKNQRKFNTIKSQML